MVALRAVAGAALRSWSLDGAAVPDDVSVVGFDDLDLCEYVTPGLTTVAQDVAGKAITAMRMLLDSVETGELPEEPVTMGVRLVERESTAPVGGQPARRRRP
ncbi:substrate-binding domain-containing protein [Actinosynnema sp. NPDC049800]